MSKTILTIILTTFLFYFIKQCQAYPYCTIPEADIKNPKDSLFANNNRLHYNISLATYISKDGSKSNNSSIPFWFTTNQNGIVPNENCGLIIINLHKKLKPNYNKLQFIYGAEFAGYLSINDNKAIISQLYGKLKKGNLQLDIGVKHKPVKYYGLSSTNGNIMWSNNSRSYPGYCLSLTEYNHFPFTPKWLNFKFEYGDYILNDNRYMGNKTMLHHKNFSLKSKVSNKLSLITELEHYAIWAGESENDGKQPHSIKNYLQVITGSSGGSSALETDKINAIGNHLGAWNLRLEYKGNLDYTFFYSHPFEDRSGREFKNYPDGNYGIFIDSKKTQSLINSFIYEFTYTKHQSGKAHDRILADGTKDIIGGNDNYFNNGVYKSGYTYFNKIMGTPFFSLIAINNKGITLGISGSRIIAHHTGIKGNIVKSLNYIIKCSYIRNYGRHHSPFLPVHKEFHTITELEYTPQKLPFIIKAATAYSKYSKSGKDLGVYIKIVKKGIF